MRALTPLELLAAWERGLAQTPAERALELLRAACPDSPPELLAGYSLGRRTAELLMFRERLFGRQMTAVANCPQCADRLELSLDSAEMYTKSSSDRKDKFFLKIGDYEINFRLPNTEDSMAIVRQADMADGRELVLRRCMLGASCGRETVLPEKLPSEVIEAVSAAMAEADPLADIEISISCPSCRHGWQAAFDIVSFLWNEIESWVWRIMSDVHALASAYGWRERDVLELSPTRRQFYLEMVGA
jgi:hypothetical protein